MDHIVCVKEEKLEQIIEKEKNVFVWGAFFSLIPHCCVFEGDRLFFLKENSGRIMAKGMVLKAIHYEKLKKQDCYELMDKFQGRHLLEENERRKYAKRNMSFIEFGEVEQICIEVEQFRKLKGWFMIEDIEEVNKKETAINYTIELIGKEMKEIGQNIKERKR